jgi:hypothetical protein
VHGARAAAAAGEATDTRCAARCAARERPAGASEQSRLRQRRRTGAGLGTAREGRACRAVARALL